MNILCPVVAGWVGRDEEGEGEDRKGVQGLLTRMHLDFDLDKNTRSEIEIGIVGVRQGVQTRGT